MNGTRFLLSALSILLLTGTLTTLAQQQSTEPRPYVAIDYMKALPGKAAEAIGLEREMWQPVHQERVASRKIDFWRVYSCQFPSGLEAEYDYVTITQYPSFAELENPYSGITPELLARILPSLRPGELAVRTEAVRKLVREDVLAVELATSGWPGGNVGVLNAGFLKTESGKSAALAQIQRDYFLPRTDAMVKAGAAASWSFMRVRFPRSEAHPYDIVSLGGYTTMAQMEAADTSVPEAFRTKEREVGVLLNATRKRVRNQLWLFVVGTLPR